VLAAAGIDLGKTYPAPIVDHAAARAHALAGYETVKATARADPCLCGRGFDLNYEQKPANAGDGRCNSCLASGTSGAKIAAIAGFVKQSASNADVFF
jgi:hypothetical protein